MKTAFIAVMSSLLAGGCASTGLYNMSDEWCAAHINATAARCPANEQAQRVAANEREQARRVAANDKEQAAATEVASND
ncbi:MAG: hypothetical protein JO299_15470 [Gammaproteobacteria bacterium]|nr:hypothetical protein [Gammaproteobacteria bacterium]